MKKLKLNLKQASQSDIDAILKEASSVIAAGGLVIYPTETTYGIGADPNNSHAIDKLLAYKSRREGKPLSVAVSDQNMAKRYVNINQQAQNFYQRFLPGAYTVISQLKNDSPIDQRVASEFKTLGIRIPDYPLVLTWLKKIDQGITATSANVSDQKRPYNIDDLLEKLPQKQKTLIDLIIDVGQLPKNEPSVVIDTSLSTPLAMRGQLDSEKKYTTFQSHSESETSDLAGRLLLKNWNRLHKQGLIFGLNGELGMGKTVFAKGIAAFLKIEETIASPTYSYMNEYNYHRHQTQGIFYHLDAWKIDQTAELALLDLENLIKSNNVIVIEWWQQIAAMLPKELRQKVIVLELTGHDQERQLKLWENNN